MRLPRRRALAALLGQLSYCYVPLRSMPPHLAPRPLVFALQYCDSSDKKNLFDLEKKGDILKDVLKHKKVQLKNTEHRLRQRGEEIVRAAKHQKDLTGQRIRDKKEHIIKDILETKAKVKEKFEEVVERENVYTIPNILCVARIVMSPYLGYVILQEQYHLALGLWLLAGVTDVLDGWIARTWSSQSSRLGSFLDPMADKVLVGTLFVSLTWQELIPLSLTLLIIARDVVLVTAGFVIRYRSLPPPRTLSRYFDVTHATAQLAPTAISKANTAVQLLLVGSTLAAPVLGYVDHPALQVLCGVTAVTTVVSAFSYIFSKDTYRVLAKYLRRLKRYIFCKYWKEILKRKIDKVSAHSRTSDGSNSGISERQTQKILNSSESSSEY